MSQVLVVGSVNIDRIVEVARIPRPGETVSAIVARIAHGGKGGNQAHYAARTAAPSTAVRLVARVGDDGDGTSLRGGLADAGVDVSGIAEVAGLSGQAFILVDAAGENQITVVPGANHRWDDIVDLEIAPGDVVVLQGEIPVEVNARAAALAHRAGGFVVLNAAPFAPALLDLLEAGDVLIVNETEAEEALLAGIDVATPGPGLAYDLVVTLGAQGSRVRTAPRGSWASIPAFPAVVVDSVGAGDAFVGALASALAEGAALPDAALFGAAAASLAVATRGARSPHIDRTGVQAVVQGAGSC